MNQNDYIEKCIASLPTEKQSLARQAFDRLGEGADSGDLISSLLIIFEATAAHAETIPRLISEERQSLHEVLEANRKMAFEDRKKTEQALEEKISQTIEEQFPVLAQQLRLADIKEEMSAQSAGLGRINRSIERLREWRMARLLFLMGVSLFAGVLATYTYCINQEEQAPVANAAAEKSLRFVNALNAAGLTLELRSFDDGVHLIISGPPLLRGSGLRKDARGITNGAELVFKNNGSNQ